MTNRVNKFLSSFQLKGEVEDFKTVYESIEQSIDFKGTNLWVLIFAILIASVGLNMNSTPVIIGAMLISPLMGPINGMGYSMATYDFSLFRRSINNYILAILVSLFTSALYFIISPVNTAHPELLARTSPTIYDVFIAVFGGVAGMLAISSRLKGNVIPGVAIATALMPPICTAGYGLATLQFNFFFGAFYLFAINTVFIAIASMVVAQILKFPIRGDIDDKRRRKINQSITAVIIVMIIPSIFFGYQLVQNEHFFANYRKFINEVSVTGKNYLIESKLNDNNKKIQLIYSGYEIDNGTVENIRSAALRHNLDTARISITTTADADVIRTQRAQMQSETDILTAQLNASKFALQKSEEKIDSLMNIPKIGKNLLTEIQQLYPQINSFAYAETYIYPDTVLKPVMIITTAPRSLKESDRAKIEDWTRVRLINENVNIIFIESAKK
ncbi:MAG: TIGR00341 family protein [Fermentimonas sp.]|jgi:uncharacterized hydrophobic protein (TIGR00271 family)